MKTYMDRPHRTHNCLEVIATIVWTCLKPSIHSDVPWPRVDLSGAVCDLIPVEPRWANALPSTKSRSISAFSGLQKIEYSSLPDPFAMSLYIRVSASDDAVRITE